MRHGNKGLTYAGTRRWLLSCLVIVLFLLLGAELGVEKHPPFAWAGKYGFFAIYGFLSSILLLVLAQVLRVFVRRNEEYYDR